MIRIFEDLEALSRAAAEQIAALLETAVQERGECRWVLSGGRTPQQTYGLLARSPFKNRIPWSNLEIFWGDERCVPPGDDRHNAANARQVLLDKVPVAPDRVHPIVCDASPHTAAQAYDTLLRRKLTGPTPVLDVTLLGLGADGHTASLFPQTPVVQEEHRWAAEVHNEHERIYRISMTPVLLNQSRHIIFLISGGAKARTLKQVLEGPYNPLNRPAQLIQPHQGECIWMVDRAAAEALEEVEKTNNEQTGRIP